MRRVALCGTTLPMNEQDSKREKPIPDPPHLGELIGESMEAAGWTVTETAARLDCERGTLSRLLNGRAGLSANMALALEAIGWGAAEHWMCIQAAYELARARRRRAGEKAGKGTGTAVKTETAPAFVQLIERLRDTGGLKDIDIANFAGVSVAAVSRWEIGREAPRPKMQLFVSNLAWVVTRLGKYYCPDEIRIWLYAPHPQLDGDRAIDSIRDDHTEDVLAMLDRLDAAACL